MLSEEGKNYICINFGSNNCCVASGLSWTYHAGTESQYEEGGTAQIVARLASGLIDYIEVRGQSYTQAQLDSVNGSSVTLEDAQTIAQHDEGTSQWCVGSSGINPLIYAGIGVGLLGVLLIGMKLIETR